MEHNELQQENTASKKVLGKILAQEVTMRPRAYFIIKATALIVVAILVLLLSVSVGSFILFSIRTSSEISLLGFGLPGYFIFLNVFPWWLLLLDIGCIILLEWMLRKFRFGYKNSLLYLLSAIVVVTLFVTILIDQSGASDRALRSVRNHNIPLLGTLYDQGRRPPPIESGACPCIVKAINGNTLTMEETLPDGINRQVMVILPSNQATSSMYIGEHLFIVGNFANGVIHALGLHPN